MSRQLERRGGEADRRLPAGWTWTTLGDLAVVVRNGVSKAPRESTGVPIFRISAVRPLRLNVDDVRYLPGSVEDYDGFRVEPGDLLFTRYNGNPALVGVCAAVPPTAKGIAHPDKLIRVVLGDGLLPDFVAGAVAVGSSRQFVERHTRSTAGQAGISGGDLKQMPVPVAPPAEQRRIAESLDSYLSRLDDTVATLERVQRNLKRYRASVLKAAVEGRLVPTEAELARQEGRDYEPADALLSRILKERKARWIEQEAEKAPAKAQAKAKKAGKRWGNPDDQAALEKARSTAAKKYKEPESPDTSKLPELPEGWCWATTEQLTLEDRPICYGVLKAGPHVEGGVPLVRVKDVVARDLSLSSLKHCAPEREAKFARARLTPGDLLVTKDGTIGRVAIVPSHLDGANVTQHVLRVAFSTDLDARYMLRALEAPRAQSWMKGEVRGVALQGINVSDFRRLPIGLPPKAEQPRVIDAVEKALSVADANEAQIVANRTRAKRLRQSILKWAFEGKLVDQDPNDEPASVLLDRIKAEREAAQSTAKRNRKPARKKRKKRSA